MIALIYPFRKAKAHSLAMVIFRPYQAECMAAFYQYYHTGRGGHGLIVVPTAGGKSLIIGGLATDICQRWPGQRILILAHVQELIEQNHAKVMLCWQDAHAGIYSSALRRREYQRDIVTASIQSVYAKAAELGWRDLCFIDEAHLVQFANRGMYNHLLQALWAINPRMKVCGFSATDYRLDGGPLTEGDGAIFDDIIIEIPIEYLLNEGYITSPRGKSQEVQANLKGLSRTANGDFNTKKMAARFDQKEFIAAALDSDMPHLQDRRTIAIFNATIENATHVAEALLERGIPCEVVDGNMHKDDREDKFERFRSGELRALASVGVMTTGTDIPNIDCEILFFATQSPGKLKQVLGRGLRVMYAPGHDLSTKEGRLAAIASGPKPDFLVLDHGGNIERHGPLTSMEKPRKREKGEREKIAPMKARICKICRDGWPLDARICKTCGTALVVERDATASLSIEASNADVLGSAFLRGDVAQWFNVDDVGYEKYEKFGKPDSLKITYFCGIMQFNEWIRLDTLKGRQWWWQRTDSEKTQRLVDALAISGLKMEDFIVHTPALKKPSRIQVVKNNKFYEVIRHDFQPASEKRPDIAITGNAENGRMLACAE